MTLTDRDTNLIKTMLLGGAEIGGGIGLGQAGLNYLKYLKHRADSKKLTNQNDNTLTLTVDDSGKTASIGLGVGMAGGAVSLLLANALVRQAYQKMIKKPEVEADLAAAQHRHLNVLDEDADAASSKQAALGAGGHAPTGFETLTSLPVAGSILAALAGGSLVYNALDKTFPPLKKVKSPLPDKVRVVSRNSDDARDVADSATDDLALAKKREMRDHELNKSEEPGAEDITKLAGWDFVTHMALQAKSASCESDMADWVYATASGRFNELQDIFVNQGFDDACEMVKGASVSSKVSDRAIDLAVILLNKSAALSPVFQTMVAGEYYDSYPRMVKAAGDLADDEKQAMSGYAHTLGAEYNITALWSSFSESPLVKTSAEKREGSHEKVEELMKQLIDGEVDAPADKPWDLNDRSRSMLAEGSSETGDGDALVDSGEKYKRDIPEMVMGLH